MSEIKPAEVSAILKKQLADVDLDVALEEVGTVLTVGDGIARVYGLNNAQSGELVEFATGEQGIVQNLEEDNVGVVMLAEASTINEGDTVKRTKRIASIKVGEGLVGRVINTIGHPIDGKGPIEGEMFEMPIERKAPGVIFRQPVEQPLQTGIKAIDSMIPIGRGQRELIIGDRRVLHLCGMRTEGLDGGQSGKKFGGEGRDGVYYCGGGYGIGSCCHAVLRSLCGCCYRRIFPRHGTQRSGDL